MSWSWVFNAAAVVSLCGIIVFFIWIGRFLEQHKNLQRDVKSIQDEKLGEKIGSLTAQINTFLMFMRNMSLNIADALRDHKRVEIDELIDKLNRETITTHKLQHLSTLLHNDFIETKSDTDNAQNYRLGLATMISIVDTKISEVTGCSIVTLGLPAGQRRWPDSNPDRR